MNQEDRVSAHLRRSLELSQEQWQALEHLAQRFHTDAQRGPTAGAPTWRRLIALIADGEIDLQKAK